MDSQNTHAQDWNNIPTSTNGTITQEYLMLTRTYMRRDQVILSIDGVIYHRHWSSMLTDDEKFTIDKFYNHPIDRITMIGNNGAYFNITDIYDQIASKIRKGKKYNSRTGVLLITDLRNAYMSMIRYVIKCCQYD